VFFNTIKFYNNIKVYILFILKKESFKYFNIIYYIFFKKKMYLKFNNYI